MMRPTRPKKWRPATAREREVGIDKVNATKGETEMRRGKKEVGFDGGLIDFSKAARGGKWEKWTAGAAPYPRGQAVEIGSQFAVTDFTT